MIEQLQQLTKVTWDGNLISKQERDRLVKNGFAQRAEGYNWITEKGVLCLSELNLMPKGVRP